MGRQTDRRQRRATTSAQIVFDGISATATTKEASATVNLKGHSASSGDSGKVLVIRGGENFLIGPYVIVSVDVDSHQWTLDRPCTTGAGQGMIGQVVNQKGKWHEPVKQYFDPNHPDNPEAGEARQHVLEALNLIEPRILESLGQICLRCLLPEPGTTDERDWSIPLHHLHWAHLKEAGSVASSPGMLYPDLLPLRTSLIEWSNDEPEHRWNLCDSEGALIEWIAEAAVQTLVCWQQRGRLRKNLKWESLEFHRYRSLDSDEALEMFGLERHFDAGSGYGRFAPEHGPPDSYRLSDRVQRKAKQKYGSLGEKLGLVPMPTVSERYFEWYAKRTFLGLRLRDIREWELARSRDRGVDARVGDPLDPEDLSAVYHGIAVVAALVGFRR